MLGGVIALTGLAVVWGVLAYKVNQETNWTKFRKSIQNWDTVEVDQ